MLFNKKQNQINAIEERIGTLKAQRDVAKAKIRAITEEMKTLVQKGVHADDLDKKIYSLDYEAKKGEFEAESEHFSELSRLISQLMNVQIAYARKDSFAQVASVREEIDVTALEREEDETAIRKEMLREKEEAIDDILSTNRASTVTFKSDPEYERLVREATHQLELETKHDKEEMTGSAQDYDGISVKECC